MKPGIKKNVNFGLLIMIVALVVSLAAASIYYQTTFKSIKKEHDTKMSELQKVTSTLLEKKEELAQTTAKQETLESKYTDVKEEKESLEDQIDSLEDQVSQKTNELLAAREDIKNKEALITSYQKDIKNLEDDKQDLQGEIDDICEEAAGKAYTLENC